MGIIHVGWAFLKAFLAVRAALQRLEIAYSHHHLGAVAAATAPTRNAELLYVTGRGVGYGVPRPARAPCGGTLTRLRIRLD